MYNFFLSKFYNKYSQKPMASILDIEQKKFHLFVSEYNDVNAQGVEKAKNSMWIFELKLN